MRVDRCEVGKVISNSDKVVELQKQQAASDVSVLEWTAELKKVKAQLVQVTAETLKLSMKWDAVLAETDKKHEELAGVHSARDCVEDLERYIVNQSVGTVDAFVNQVGVQLVDRFCAGLEDTYAGSQVPFSYRITHVSVVGASSVEV